MFISKETSVRKKVKESFGEEVGALHYILQIVTRVGETVKIIKIYDDVFYKRPLLLSQCLLFKRGHILYNNFTGKIFICL